VFEVYSQSGEIKSCKFENGQLVKGQHRSYLISAETKQEMDSWVAAIRNNISFNPIFELIKKRMDKHGGDFTEPIDKRKETDFQELHDACMMCTMAYKSSAAIKEAYGMSANVVEDSERNMRYFLLTNERSKTQTIVLCGLVPDTVSPTKAIDVFSTFGFDKAADQIDSTLVKFLRRDFAVHVYGHSLGAALALLFALHLRNGGYRVDKVITFGQPRIVKDKETPNYRSLPIVRVVDYYDVVPTLFAGYFHVGSEVVLFQDTYYSLLEDHIQENGVQKKFDNNHTESYLRNIRLKLKNPVLIPYEQRNSQIGKHHG